MPRYSIKSIPRAVSRHLWHAITRPPNLPGPELNSKTIPPAYSLRQGLRTARARRTTLEPGKSPQIQRTDCAAAAIRGTEKWHVGQSQHQLCTPRNMYENPTTTNDTPSRQQVRAGSSQLPGYLKKKRGNGENICNPKKALLKNRRASSSTPTRACPPSKAHQKKRRRRGTRRWLGCVGGMVDVNINAACSTAQERTDTWGIRLRSTTPIHCPWR